MSSSRGINWLNEVELQAGRLIVLEPGRFTLCANGASTKQVVARDALAEFIGDATPIGPSQSIEVPETAVVRCRRALACQLWPDGLKLFLDTADEWITLGVVHLDVLNVLTADTPAAALCSTLGITHAELQPVLSDLVVVGLVWIDSSVSEHDPAGPHVPEPSEEVPQPTSPTAPIVVSASQPQVDRPRLLDRFQSVVKKLRPLPPQPAAEPTAQTSPESLKIPVYSFWATVEGPHMGGAAVVAYAREFDAGVLNEAYDFKKVMHVDDVLEEISKSAGPAVLLCSNYIWSLGPNLEAAARSLEMNPDIVVIHGGPSVPRQSAEAATFLTELSGAHVLVSGEGEITFAETLHQLAQHRGADGLLSLTNLAGVAGVSYIDPETKSVVVNQDRERHQNLEDFPSPLLSGEFDLVPVELIRQISLPVETVRGCPYGCSFCDWGQATMTRLRKFPMERVLGELQWMADQQVVFWVIADANWGMLPRDLEIAEAIAELHHLTGYPLYVGAGPPKNSTDRYVELVDTLLTAGVSLKVAIALQSRDEATLEAINRSNIKTSVYDRITAEMRSRGLPLHCELMVGLPGATVESFKADLQWCVSEGVRPHLYRTFVLPNAPLNEPEYRREHGVVVEEGMVVATSSYSRAEGELMRRVAYAFQSLEMLGLLRYVLRYLEWEQGRETLDVVNDIVAGVDDRSDEFPLLSFVLWHFDEFLIPPSGWAPFYEEAHRFLIEHLGLDDNDALRTALLVDRQTTPWPDRSVPFEVELPHDYEAYFAKRNRTTIETGESAKPLADYGPGVLRIVADPDEVATNAFGRQIDVDAEIFPGFTTAFWEVAHLEMLSSLTVYEPMSHRFVEQLREWFPKEPEPPKAVAPAAEPSAQPVSLGRRK